MNSGIFCMRSREKNGQSSHWLHSLARSVAGHPIAQDAKAPIRPECRVVQVQFGCASASIHSIPMKTLVIFWVGLLPFCHGSGQEARFFRVVSSTATRIISVTQAGSITWTNAHTNVICTVQTALNLRGGTNWVDYVQVPVSNLITTVRLFDLTPPSGTVFIPAGSFTMGDNLDGDSAELPLHTVYVSPFYMDRYETTKALWDNVFQWATNHGYSFDHVGLGKGTNYPVDTINWYDCVKWCNARSEMEGRTPAYYTNAAQTAVYRTGTNDLNSGWVKWNAGYRLPTEAEWEKAGRGGLSGFRFPWGNTISIAQANYYSCSSCYPYDLSNAGYNPPFQYNDGVTPYTSPVDAFAANGYGLYDMAGNVVNWCWDWYGAYSSASQSDPRGPATGPGRLTRGGCWCRYSYDCRVQYRRSEPTTYTDDGAGLRTVLAASQP